MSKTAVSVYNKTNDKLEFRDRGKLLLVSETSNKPKATNDRVDERPEVRTIVQVVTPEPNQKRLENKNRTTTTSTIITAEPLQLATSRSIGDNRITLLGPIVSGRRASPIVVHGKLIGQIPHPSNHRGSNGVTVVEDVDDDEDNEANFIVDADVYHNRYEIYSGCYS